MDDPLARFRARLAGTPLPEIHELPPPPPPKLADLEEIEPTEEQTAAVADQIVDLDSDKQMFIYRHLLAKTAHLEDTRGFAAFYDLVHDRSMPPISKAWIEAFFEAIRDPERKGVVIEAWRGSFKTTTITITLTAWMIGLHPELNHLLIQVSDDVAFDNSRQIADVIQNNEGFKLAFPNVVPDKELGWGAGGYEVKRTDIGYSQWRAMNSRRKDPTLIGVGYRNSEILGKHPRGLLIVDDICDENNTASLKELAYLRRIVTDTIFPTMTKGTMAIFVGTPWVENDVLAHVKATGKFVQCKTPVFTEDHGEKTYADPKNWGEHECEMQLSLSGEVGFARMYLLDLEAAKGIYLKREWLHEYPASDIKPSWPVVFGIDYASTMDKIKDRARDDFCLAIMRSIPGGGLVLVDGYLGKISKGEALDLIVATSGLYPTLLRIGVETLGKGEEFYNDLLLTRDLNGKPPPLVPIQHGAKAKGARFEDYLAPLFRAARIWISDTPTPFMLKFIDHWVSWPKGPDDSLDGVYMAAIAGEGFLPAAIQSQRQQEARRKNPFSALGRK